MALLLKFYVLKTILVWVELLPKENVMDPSDSEIIRKIDLVQDDNFLVNCIDSYVLTWEDPKKYTVYHNEIELSDFWIWFDYLWPNECEYDMKNWSFIDNWTLIPQWYPTKYFEDRVDFKEFKACLFTPIDLYKYSWDIEKIIKYVEQNKSEKYKEIKYDTFDWYGWYRDKLLNKQWYFWDSIMSLLKSEEIKIFGLAETKKDSVQIKENFLIFNVKENILIDLEIFGEDCWWYPQVYYIQLK